MEKIVYRLRDVYADDPAATFVGGLIKVGDGELDVAKALKSGKGKITADSADTALLTALDGYDPLERAEVIQTKPSIDEVTDPSEGQGLGGTTTTEEK